MLQCPHFRVPLVSNLVFPHLLMWLFRSQCLRNAFLHRLHLNFFNSSSVWTRIMCVFWFETDEHFFPQSLQEVSGVGSVSLCLNFVCLFSSAICLKDLGQLLHLKFLGSWTITCSSSFVDDWNILGHFSQTNVSPNSCLFMCWFLLCEYLKDLSHFWHEKGRSSEWVTMCCFRSALTLNCFSHERHLWGGTTTTGELSMLGGGPITTNLFSKEVEHSKLESRLYHIMRVKLVCKRGTSTSKCVTSPVHQNVLTLVNWRRMELGWH